MIDLQGGSISVRSRLGEGTTFYVDIPYSLGKAAVKKTEAVNCSAISGRRIMVVDDVAINTTITCRLLERHGAVVDCAENAGKRQSFSPQSPIIITTASSWISRCRR